MSGMTNKKNNSALLSPARIAALYVLAGGLWIFFSDRLLRVVVSSPDALTRLQTYKGWFFVIGTAGLLVWLIRRYATELRRSEVEVRHAGEQLDHVFERITDGVVALNTDWVYTYVNNRAGEMFNRKPEDLIGRRIWTEFPEAIGQPFHKAYAQAMKTQEPVQMEDYYAPWDRWFENRIYPSQDGLTIYFQDVTDRKKIETKLIHANRLYAVLSQINQAIVRIKDRDRLFREACCIAVEYGKFRMAWIGLVDDEHKLVRPAHHCGIEDGYLDGIKISLADEPEGRGPTGTAIRQGKRFICNDIRNDPGMVPWRDKALASGYASSGAFPIKLHGSVVGTVNLYSGEPQFFKEDEINLVEEITDDIAYALENIEKEARLVESEKKFRTAFENAAIGMSLTGVDGGFMSVNEALCRMLGYSAEELMARTFGDGTHPEDLAISKEVVMGLLEGKRVASHFEKRYLHRDGHVIWTMVSTFLVRNETDEPLYFITHIQDITERIKAEESVRRNEHLLQLFVEHSPAAIAMLDRDMKYIVASRRFLTDYNLGDQSIIGLSHYELFPEISERWREIHRRCLAGAVERAEEDPFPRADGKTDWVRWEIRPWYETMGDIGGIILFSEVITQRKQVELELERHRDHLEELVQERTAELQNSQRALKNIVADLNGKTAELETANDRLKELDRLKSLFIASMSHELRTPLNSVIGFSSILLHEWVGPLNDEQKENLASVLRSGKHLLALINDVIDVSKIEAGVIEIMTAEFDLYDLIEEAADGLRGEARNKGLAFTVEPVHQAMRTDRRRLLQSVLNLMSNAVKFTEKGEVRLSARRAPEKCGTKGMDCVEIIVQDTGIGISAEDLPKLFTSFTRLESPLKGKVLGTGLGLYLTKKITTDILQGEVEAASEPGVGSRFTLRIPLFLEKR
jgi:PAS domain S-box-containing protein